MNKLALIFGCIFILSGCGEQTVGVTGQVIAHAHNDSINLTQIVFRINCGDESCPKIKIKLKKAVTNNPIEDLINLRYEEICLESLGHKKNISIAYKRNLLANTLIRADIFD